MRPTYPKLIRDRIPEILEKQGIVADVKKLETDEEYLRYLMSKIVEESLELQASKKDKDTKEELADIFEVIYAILKLKNWTLEDIIAIQKSKRELRGGFDDRLLMHSKPVKKSKLKR